MMFGIRHFENTTNRFTLWVGDWITIADCLVGILSYGCLITVWVERWYGFIYEEDE